MKIHAAKILVFVVLLSFAECRSKKNKVDHASLSSIDLNRGEIVSCGPHDGEMFGTVSFSASVADYLQKGFNIAVALLNSFEFDDAVNMFAKFIDQYTY